MGLNLACIVLRAVPSLHNPICPYIVSGDESSDDKEYLQLKESYRKLTDLYSGDSMDADKLRDKLKATCIALGVTH
jgi:hypothetical protein